MDPTTLGSTSIAPAAAAPAEHGEEAHPHAKYFQIWFILLVVTLLEVGVAVVLPKGFWRTFFLVGMALYKAVIVALFFMHLKFERKAMWIIASAPLIFGAILYCGATPDSDRDSPHFFKREAPAEKHE